MKHREHHRTLSQDAQSRTDILPVSFANYRSGQTRGLFYLAVLAAALTTFGWAADAPVAAAPSWETKPDIAGIVATVPPLQHPLGDFHPTLFWWQAPLSFDDPAQLKTELRALSERGLLPCVGLEAEFNVAAAQIAKAIAHAQAIARAGFPVHIQILGQLDLYLHEGKRVQHADSPAAGQLDAVGGTMPCLVLKTGWQPRADHIRGLLQQVADAKVPVAAVWYDYEAHPHPFNGVFEMNAQCPSCRRECPPGVLDDRARFVAWVHDWRADVMATVFAAPVRAVFPRALVGHYGYSPSTARYPTYQSVGLQYPPAARNPVEIDVAMPVCYADVRLAPRYFNADWPVTGPQMDAAYFASLLRTVSNVHHNLRPNQRLMPFVSGYISAPGKESVPRMSPPLYREFLRHAILRGARGFYCFNVAPPYGLMPDYYGELAEINHVYNEMLAHREFYAGGTVLNDDWPDPKSVATVWSGLRQGKRAVVRVVTLHAAPQTIEIVPFPGVAVKLLAPPTGMTYLVDATGHAQAVE